VGLGLNPSPAGGEAPASPRPAQRPPKTLVIRLGAIGDLMFITPVLKGLKALGEEVGLVCKPHGRAIFHGSGLVDRLHVWRGEDEAWARAQGGPSGRVAAAWQRAEAVWGAGYDRILILDDIIENHYLWPTSRLEVVAGCREGAWVRQVEDHSPWERGERPFRYDNYYEILIEAAGLTGRVEPEPVWRVLPAERRWAAKFKRRRGLAGRRLGVIQLSGSGPNKAWPYWPRFCRSLLAACPDLALVTLGVQADQLLEWGWTERKPRIIPLASRQTVAGQGFEVAWNRLRREVALIEAADLFVGPDSSVLHCAGALATPKVALMTICHGRNVLTHYRNCLGLQSEAPCSPCGKLTLDCYRGTRTGAILCMERLDPGRVLAASLAALSRSPRRQA